MSNFIGLYYPFIHFKDDTWLKHTALYWDKVARIVPSSYLINSSSIIERDSDTVKRLAGELDFVKNVQPEASSEQTVADAFITFLHQYEPLLQKKYAVKDCGTWPIDPITSKAAPEGSEQTLAYIHIEKIEEGLKNVLVESGLALPNRIFDDRWIGMHPKLASVYMTSLAEEIARSSGFHPLTDETIDHFAVSGLTMERLSQALLENVQLVDSSLNEQEVKMHMASFAIATVLPKNLKNVPIDKIIFLRKNYGQEIRHFQNYLDDFAKNAKNLTQLKNEKVLQLHLEQEYKSKLEPELNELRKVFQGIGLDTTVSIMNLNVILPTLLCSALPIPLNPIFAGVGALALNLIPVIRDKQKEVRDAVTSTPAAYLMRIEEGLQPQTFSTWVNQSVKRFMFGS